MARSSHTSTRTKTKTRRQSSVLRQDNECISQMKKLVVLCVSALCLLGLVMVYSASSVRAARIYHNQFYFLMRQAIFMAIGLILCYVSYRALKKHNFTRAFITVIWAITVIALLGVVAMGVASHGARRWVTIAGFTFQPAEFAKVSVLLIAADIFSRYDMKNIRGNKDFLTTFTLGCMVPLALIFFQPDKGSAAILAGAILCMAYFSGLSGRAIVGFVVIGIVFILIMSMRDDYSRQRLFAAFDPFKDEFGTGYQKVQGIYALAGGGLFGVGIGNSRQKYSYLPEAHNDFIFPVIGEELGFIGACVVILLFILFAYAGYKIATQLDNHQFACIVFGATTLLIMQSLVNIGGVLSLIPLSGKPLPFVSYGGSSIISCLLLVGCILGAASRSDNKQDKRLRLVDEKARKTSHKKERRR